MDRRTLITQFGAGLAAAALPARASASPAELVAAVHQAFQRHGNAIRHRDVAALADYSAASQSPRFHILDLAAGRIQTLLVAHGKGSDPAHTGRLLRFSDAPGSEASSKGAFMTGDPYIGKHGRSQRLIGLEPTNANALSRAIVIHGAWYVGPQMLSQHGKLGRSQGCFAFAEADLQTVLARLGPGRLLLSAQL